MERSGQNRGYIDELYASYRTDPTSVSPAWRAFFEDYRPDAPAPAAARKPEAAVETRPAPGAVPTPLETAVPLRGAAARLAENMTTSLGVPTATSARTIPVRVLEENRRMINQHQETVAGPRVSFTHLIAWSIVRALVRHPALNAGFVERDGRPHRLDRPAIHLGLAVDVERAGERVLLVPNVKNAQTLDFSAFVAALDDLVNRARHNRLGVEDFQGTTVTLTNPGMLGTALSVPRLMQGQGTILGVGAIGLPAEFAGMAPAVVTQLGLSKVMTVTSTYDHRVIQGAESGAFLADLERLLLGEERLYDELFADLGVPHEPLRWAADAHPVLTAAQEGSVEAIAKQAAVLQLIRSYRVRGHLWADLDPLGFAPEPHPELELATYGLSVWDLDRRFVAGGLGGSQGTLELREILDTLKRTYCGHIGVEYMHIQEPALRHWLQERLERPDGPLAHDRERQMRILKKLNAAEAFESFLASHYVGQKRFSLEGAETLIPMLDALLDDCAEAGVEEVVIGMAHRGRLNVLANVIGKSYRQIFREFEGDLDPQTTHGSGDVKYHLGASGVHEAPGGGRVRLTVASNPSHLEAVDPVVEGLVRARQDRRGDLARRRVLPLLVHGDAAFCGQGVVAETLNLSQLKGYRTGGTIHVVVNNQIGFTTGPADLRSSRYPTDVAKMLHSPIFHVNGDQPEDAVRVMRLALAFRQTYQRDVVVDLVCYRRFGHNEADDPSYTHPILYAKIREHRSVRKRYTEQLVRRGDFDIATAEQALEDFHARLRDVHDEVRQAERDDGQEPPSDLEATRGRAVPRARTGVPRETLERIVHRLSRGPEGFEVHPKLARLIEQRRTQFEGDRIDWSLAEALAFGTLLLEGTPVRLSGEDSSRGTFSQRHGVLHDHRTAAPYTPLADLAPGQAPFHVHDSLLSEFAVLGFEYGYSVGDPRCLVLWEAQFGDFANGAQVIIDQFVTSAEDKWNQQSGLVLLLPHGHEGQGPEHSSARLERFLQLAAMGNVQIVSPTTPAQYFHLLRAQARWPDPRPLVVMTPKSLLRHKDCTSTRAELESATFDVVLDDPHRESRTELRRLLLCAGKVYYDLDAARREYGADAVAIVRVEQLYPFPEEEIAALLERCPAGAEIAWVQEEPRNMGAWGFVRERTEPLLPQGRALGYVGRPRRASPASGSARRHAAAQAALVREALGLPAAGLSSSPAAARGQVRSS